MSSSAVIRRRALQTAQSAGLFVVVVCGVIGAFVAGAYLALALFSLYLWLAV